ncbi:hypothetical protein [Dokdonella sp.]|uniref:hypothetical protein n=1 Tax=Dokdonella sp. TaxID=2291710 RepID=UPI003C6204C4
MNISAMRWPLGILLSLAALGSTTALATVPTAELTPLSIDFNNKTPGQPLGTGGAALGEPADLEQLDTRIVESSPGENYLQVSTVASPNIARHLHWTLEDDAELSEGLVSVSLDFTPSVRDSYSFGIRERDGAAREFMSLSFNADGRLYALDAAGLIGEFFDVYNGGDTLEIEMLFDMDARTSSLSINGTSLFSARAHGVSDRGIGTVLTGFSSSTSGSLFALDNLLVLASAPLPLVLDTDFNNQPPGQPIGTGGAVDGEPVYFSSTIAQQAYLAGINNVALRLWSTARSPIALARWEFLNNLEIRTGTVAIHLDVRLDSSQWYEINVNGPPNASTRFSSIRFTPDRRLLGRSNVEIVDSRGYARIVGTFRPRVFQHLQILFDMDRGTYTVKLDGAVLVDGWRHGVRNGSGISSLQTGFQKQGVIGRPMDIDNLQVGASDFVP